MPTWTLKHVLTVLIIVLGLVGVVVAIGYFTLESGERKRAQLQNCIDSGSEPLECRLAVYGHVG